MAHQLALQDGILHVTFVGDIDVEDWMDYIRDYAPFLDQTTPEDPLDFLVDGTQMGKFSAAARKLLVDDFRNPNPRIGKTAMVGASRYVRVLASFILKATGRSNVRLFETEKDALVWLQEGN
jgi:hypothetical protein